MFTDDPGPKFGFNTVDNGFILFDNIRVPHIAMMARYSKIDKASGDYIKVHIYIYIYYL